MNVSVREPPPKQDLKVPSSPSTPSLTRDHLWRPFWRHFVEMSVVMGVGMFASAFAFMVILNLVVAGDVTWEDALVDYPAHALLAVAIGMSLPMVPWMRRRGHTKRSAYEMAIVMGVLAIPFICLALLNVVKGAECGLYCGLGFVAMLVLMLYRKSEYDHHQMRGQT